MNAEKDGSEIISPKARDLWVASPTLSTALLAVLVACPMAVIVVDDFGVVIGWSKLATEMFGWTARETIGLPMHDLVVPPAMRDECRRSMARRRSNGECKIIDRSGRTEALNKNGQSFPVHLSFSSGVEYGRMFYIVFITDLRLKRAARRSGARSIIDRLRVSLTPPAERIRRVR